MAKPWGKIELDYINHDKFLALNSNAIVLWHEGKNYCDLKLTDGLIPTDRAKRFRFYSKKAVAMLTSSCGPKPGTDQQYAPLWEVHPVGFKMHDYIEHNDCRETVLERIAKADADNQRKRENQREWRERRKAERRQAAVTLPVTLPVTETVSAITEPVTREERSALLPDKQKQHQHQNQNQHQIVSTHARGVLAGTLPRNHLRHAVCGRVCLHDEQFAQFIGKFGGSPEAAAVAVRTWAEGVVDEWGVSPKLEQKIGGTNFQFWDARWEEWQGGAPKGPSPMTNKRIAGAVAGGEAFLRRQG